MGKDQQNCPFCESEKKKESGGWALNQENWKDMKRKHEREHGPIIKERA